MSLLTIVQNAAIEAGQEIPNVVIGNTDTVVRRLLRAANRCGMDVMERVPWQKMRRIRTFTGTLGSTQAGAIPADYSRMIPDTLWNRSTTNGPLLITGPLPPDRWEYVTTGAAVGNFFTIYGNTLYIWPGLAGGESMQFEYVSNAFATSSDGLTLRSAWAADSDVGLVSEELLTLGTVAYFQMALDMPMAGPAMAAYEARLMTLVNSDNPVSGIVSAGDVFGSVRGQGALTEYSAFTLGESVLT